MRWQASFIYEIHKKTTRSSLLSEIPSQRLSSRDFLLVLAHRTMIEFWLLFPDSAGHFIRIRVFVAEICRTRGVALRILYCSTATMKSQLVLPKVMTLLQVPTIGVNIGYMHQVSNWMNCITVTKTKLFVMVNSGSISWEMSRRHRGNDWMILNIS